MEDWQEAVTHMPDEEHGRLGLAHRRQEARYVKSGLRQRYQVQADQAAHWGIRQNLHEVRHIMELALKKKSSKP